jgi:hypothetical protein
VQRTRTPRTQYSVNASAGSRTISENVAGAKADNDLKGSSEIGECTMDPIAVYAFGALSAPLINTNICFKY